LTCAGNKTGDAVLGKDFGIDSSQLSEFDQREEIAAEKRALRALLDSFRAEPEMLFEKTLNAPATRRTIGKFIGHSFVKPYSGER
jgi:hypothetical protein